MGYNASMMPQGTPNSPQQTVKFDKLLDFIEDFEDILEYCQEIFEIENETTRELLGNALMHYFFIPVIAGSLSNELPDLEGP